jgi:hypothetical protein
MSGCPFHALFGLRKDLPVGIPDRIRNLLYNADPTDLAARAEIDRRWQAMQSLLPSEVAT